MSWRAKNRESALLLVRMRRLPSSATVCIKVRSGCSAITANTRAAHFSSGDTLPPRDFGAALPLSRQRCSHLTAELTLTSNAQPPHAAMRPSPRLRSRVPAGHQNRTLASPTPEKENQCPKTRSSITLWESRRFKSIGTRFSGNEKPERLSVLCSALQETLDESHQSLFWHMLTSA